MQIVVLGMHRSGTSMLTRLINQLGAYCGEPEDFIGTNEENPKGFWERQDVRDANDAVLKGVGLDWDRVTGFRIQDIPSEIVHSFNETTANVLEQLDAHENWVLKEPRICVLMELWKPQLENPFFIHIHRNPLEVAASLEVRNGIPKFAGVALWEHYNRAILSFVGREKRYLSLSYSELLLNPYQEVSRIFDCLCSHGAVELTPPDQQALDDFVNPKLYRQKFTKDDLLNYLSPPQLQLAKDLATPKADGITQVTSEISKDCLSLYESKYLYIDEILELKREIKKLEHTRRLLENAERVLQGDLKRAEGRVQQMVQIGERAVKKIEEVHDSTTWRTGVMLNNIANMLLFKKKPPPNLNKTALEFRSQLSVYSDTSSNGNS